jgi:hypothetical protein
MQAFRTRVTLKMMSPRCAMRKFLCEIIHRVALRGSSQEGPTQDGHVNTSLLSFKENSREYYNNNNTNKA